MSGTAEPAGFLAIHVWLLPGCRPQLISLISQVACLD